MGRGKGGREGEGMGKEGGRVWPRKWGGEGWARKGGAWARGFHKAEDGKGRGKSSCPVAAL